MLQRHFIGSGLYIGLLGAVPAFGQLTTIASPADYTGSTTVLPIHVANTTSSLTDGSETPPKSGGIIG